jgi:hypothetical protein
MATLIVNAVGPNGFTVEGRHPKVVWTPLPGNDFSRPNFGFPNFRPDEGGRPLENMYDSMVTWSSSKPSIAMGAVACRRRRRELAAAWVCQVDLAPPR